MLIYFGEENVGTWCYFSFFSAMIMKSKPASPKCFGNWLSWQSKIYLHEAFLQYTTTFHGHNSWLFAFIQPSVNPLEPT
jgi:hypothetical protein